MTLAFLALLGAPYIYEISSLRVNVVTCHASSITYLRSSFFCDVTQHRFVGGYRRFETTLQTGPLACSETSVTNHNLPPRCVLEGRRPQLSRRKETRRFGLPCEPYAGGNSRRRGTQHSEELQDLCFLPKVVFVVKSRNKRWV